MKMGKRVNIAKRQAGFTLIEIMVVVIIIGLLSAMILPNQEKAHGLAIWMRYPKTLGITSINTPAQAPETPINLMYGVWGPMARLVVKERRPMSVTGSLNSFKPLVG